MVRKTRKASNSIPVDIISTMPDNVLSNILNRLPIHRAIRTSILSKSWRLKWTLITQLVFDKSFFYYLLFEKGLWRKGIEVKTVFDGRSLSRILLHLKGDITKFVIEIPGETWFEAEDISHLVLFLSQKGIQEFTFEDEDSMSIRLPTHIFYCVKLKHLKLKGCRFPFAPSFTGFPNLLSLDLYDVSFENCECWDFITRSSLLEILKISKCRSSEHTEQVNQIDIGKLKNLKKLSLSVCMLDNITSSGVFQLMEFPPKLEELTLYFCKCKAETIAGNRASSSVLFCLKSLTLHYVDFTNGIEASSIFQLIFSSPNLLTLEIQAFGTGGLQSALNFDFASMRQLQLQSVRLVCSRDSDNLVCLIKSLLAFSPVLKNMDLFLVEGNDNEKLKFALKLLKLERASPKAQINL